MNNTHSTTINPEMQQTTTELHLQIISAGAGSGKTYRLTSEMVKLLKGGVRASGIIATTFTKKAAAELQERVRVRLLEEGLTEQADELTNALIGTVHGLGVKLLKRFAFEAGVSPEVAIVAEEDQQIMFNSSLATVMTNEKVEAMERLCNQLGLHKKGYYDWRSNVMQLTDIARANDFDVEALQKSKTKSFESFKEFLGEPLQLTLKDFNEKLERLLQETIDRLEGNADETKTTRTVINTLNSFKIELGKRGNLHWWQLVKISKLKPGAKSRDDVEELQEYVLRHERLNDFQQDIKDFIDSIFDFSMEAIREYDEYKKRRGLIDYTDMEVHIKRLLKNPMVQEVLEAELDLLMVDEFQDTSPLQLEIFLQLSKFAKHSIWVGDPKQSIYGFRGAEPKLMQAIIDKTGGVKAENIQEHSWRSREDIVFATNALFCKAFSQLPEEQVALKPKRTRIATPDSKNKENEPIEASDSLIHWHFQFDGGKRLPGKPWMENCIATALQQLLDGQIFIQPKDEVAYRAAQPGDVAILCRSNAACMEMAEALHKAGLKAAISRAGLLQTAEAKLVLACMKFVLNKQDSLSIAEILLLSGKSSIEDIIEDRLSYIKQAEAKTATGRWAEDNPFIQRLNFLREQVIELSSAEILDLMLEELDLRRIIAAWGNVQPRLANVDMLRKLALQYEEACNRLHSAASLGGLLLWLNELENNNKDMQGSSETADSVNVLTYHKSKGLEYPIVICHNLEGTLRSDVWGVNIVSESDEVDLDNVLGNRWLRYWVNPYADQFGKTLLEERINQSPIKAEAIEKALQEEARLLYVGVTRARDYLVFPTRPKETKWLNRVWHQGQESYPTLDPNTHESPWEWNSRYLNIQTETFLMPKDFVSSNASEETILYIEEKTGKTAHPAYQIDLNKESLSDEIRTTPKNTLIYTPPIKYKEEEGESYDVAKALKAFMTADNLHYPTTDRQEMAQGFVQRYDLTEALESSAMLSTSEAWFGFLKKQFSIKKVYRKYPIRLHHQGRLFETIIDLVLETADGYVIIQNSGFAGEGKKWRNKAMELGGWFYLSEMGVREIFGTQLVQTYVHFVLGGGLVEVEVKVV